MATSPPVARKRDHLEALLDRFKDLAIEVILKEDLLCAGVAYADGNGLSGRPDPWRSLLLEGGPYRLLRTIVRPPIRADSAYVVELDEMDGRPVLRDRGTGSMLCYVREYPVEPSYAGRRFPDGTSLAEIVRPDGVVIAAEACPQAGAPSCPVCRRQGVCRKRAAVGQETVVHVHNPEAVGQAAFDAYALEDWPLQEAPLHIWLDAGRSPNSYEGVAEERFFLPFVEAVARRLHAVWQIGLTMLPKSWDREEALKQAGVTVRAVPLGVWDARLFPALYPELAQHLSRDQWLRWFTAAAYLYGGSAVLVDMDVGAELAEGRFSTPTEALASTKAGFKFLISHGCLPRLFHSHPAAGRGLAPVEYFLEVDRAWYEAWVDTQANEPHGYIMGIGRSRWPYSAHWDVGRGGPPEYAREWDKDQLGEPGYRIAEQPR